MQTLNDVDQQIEILKNKKRELILEERRRKGVKPKKPGRKALKITAQDVMRLRAKDMSWNRIAEELGCSTTTVFDRVPKEMKEEGIKRATYFLKPKEKVRKKKK